MAQVMADLIQEGKITHWGISEVTEDYLRRAHAICPVTAVQNRYSMMARWHEALFPVLEELNVGFIAFSPMANGLLTGAYGKDSQIRFQSWITAVPCLSSRRRRRRKTGAAEPAEQYGDGEARHPRPTLPGLDAVQKAVHRPPSPEAGGGADAENAGAAEVILSPIEVKALDKILDDIPMSARIRRHEDHQQINEQAQKG